MTASGASKHALALAIRACRRDLQAAAPTRSAAHLARDLFRAVVVRHTERVGLPFDRAEIPWLFGHAGDGPVQSPPTSVLPILARTLDDPALDDIWTDASALGWVYQFWSDESRDAIDARIGARGRVSQAEIAQKTQLFTERYMVEWLLENSVGALGRAMAARRRARLGLPPPPTTNDEPSTFVAAAGIAEDDEIPTRLRDVKLLDPACGSGHFLVAAFERLVPLYRAEAADEGRDATDADIAHDILAHNLHGLDIDSEAVRIAATVLLLTAKRFVAPAPFRAPPLALLGLGFDGAGVGPAAGVLADWALRGTLAKPSQEHLSAELLADVRASIATRGAADDLGIVCASTPAPTDERRRTLLTDGQYDVIAANPPYLATAKIDLPKARLQEIFGEMPDLFAAFVDRSLALCKPRGRIAFVAPSNWLFLSTFATIRARVLEGELLLVADLGKGAFRHASKLIQTSMVVTSPRRPGGRPPRLSHGVRLGNRATSDEHQTGRLAAALFDSSVFRPFDPAACQAIEGAPLLFWLERAFLEQYRTAPKIEDVATGAAGTATGDNERFLRAVWEVSPAIAHAATVGESEGYVPYLKGADGAAFFEPYRWLLRVPQGGLAARLNGATFELPVSPELGVAYTTIGHRFAARLHTVPSVRDVSGASFFPRGDVSVAELLCALDRTPVRDLAHALNPSINFQQVDVRRLPFERHPHAEAIVQTLRASFDADQRTRETSLSYRGPGPSTWDATQRWAQAVIDDPSFAESAPVQPTSTPLRDAVARLGAALGLVLGRFAQTEEGALRLAEPTEAGGRRHLLLDVAGGDDLDEPDTEPLHAAWAGHGAALVDEGGDTSLGHYLRGRAFAEHLSSHDGRPAYLPLASRRRSLVVLIWTQRFDEHTLPTLAARVATLLARERQNGCKKARLAELTAFLTDVRELITHGPSSPEAPKEIDAPFVPFVDDGVRVLGASLWSLVQPLWKEPRADWIALASPKGKRHFDWSRTAARYFPTRVEERCREDASLAAEHGRLRALHPQVAERWERKLTKSATLSKDPP